MHPRRARLILTVLFGALAGCTSGQSAPPGDERHAMSLKLELHLARQQLVVGEDAALTYVLTNTAASALKIPDPNQNKRWPELRVKDRKTGKETAFGPFDVAARGISEFMPVMPEINITLGPRQSTRVEALLSRRALFDGPGDYELTAAFEFDGGKALSDPVRVTIEPLNLRSAEIVGGHSGHNAYRYCAWSHAAGGGSVLVLTCGSFDQHGHPITPFSNRLTELSYAAQPVISVSANRLPYPRQWIVWQTVDELCGLYVNNGQVQLTTTPQNTGLTRARIVPPVLLDLAGNDGSKPGRGEVALWSAGAGRGRLSIRAFEADGSLSRGPDFALGDGELRWGRAAALSGGERRFVLIERSGNECAFSILTWDGSPGAAAAPQAVARWLGDVLGAGATLNDNDTLFGAAILARPVSGRAEYWLHAWRIVGDGMSSEQPAVEIMPPKDVAFSRALVELSPEGNIVGLLHASDGRWFVCNRSGEVEKLPGELARFGTPIGAFWLHEAEPFVVMAGRDTGITYQPLHPHH